MLVIKLQHNQDIRRVTIEKVVPLAELIDLAKSLFRDTLPPSFLLKYKDDEGDFITVASDRELEEAFRLFKEQGILRIVIQEVKKNEPKPKVPQSVPQQQKEQKQEKSPLDEFVEAVSPYFETIETQFRDVFPKIEGQVQEFLPNLEAMLPKLEEKFKEAEEKFKEAFSPENQVVHPAICDKCNQRIVGIRWKCQTCADFDLCNVCRQLKVHNEHEFSRVNWTAYPNCSRGSRQTQTPVPKKEEVKPESPKQEKKEEPKIEVKPLTPLRIPVKVEVPQPEKKEEQKVPIAAQSVEIPKVETPKQQEKKESPFESKLKQLEEMGFPNRARNIELLVKRKGDMIHVVKDLLE